MIQRFSGKIVLGCAVLAMALVIGVWPGENTPRSSQRKNPRVRVSKVEKTSAQRIVRFAGVTRASRRAMLAFLVPGRVVSRVVNEGDHVRAGQALGRLDDSSFVHAVQAAEAAESEAAARLAQADRDLARVERLAAARAATQEEVEHVKTGADAARAAHAAATARLAEARRALADAVLRAPFAGTITAVVRQPGEWVAPGTPFLELSGDGDVEIGVEVTEVVAPCLKAGQRVVAELPFARDMRVAGRVASVARAVIGAGRLFPVIVALDPTPGITAGMTMEVLFEVKAVAELSVPIAAVVSPGSSRAKVFVVRDGRAREVRVELGELRGDRVLVQGDLAPDEQVVVAGHTRLADGDGVEIL
ncbi:MAG: efflux RND transporter periplasmic adaptor subunit [Vicinamibacteria bacterium]|nr:efflux RND transporter periplasmic adaptor subunit [Vicinamibacteria bacterium]